MSPSRGKSRRRGTTKPPPTIVARPEEPPDARRGWGAFLGKPVWQGIGALVAVAALVVATLELRGSLRERTTISPTPADQTSAAPAPPGGTVICGIGGAGHQDSRVRCDLGAPGPARSTGAGQDPPALAGARVGPLLSPRSTSNRPGVTQPKVTQPKATQPKATQPGTSRPTTAAPAPTTRNPVPPEPPPAGIVTTSWPTFVAVQRGGGATAVATQGAADFQVEAQHVSPLHGTEIERTAGACRHSAAYTVHGVGFEPADGARFCVRTRLGDMVVLEIVPSPDADTRPYPYTLRIGPA